MWPYLLRFVVFVRAASSKDLFKLERLHYVASSAYRRPFVGSIRLSIRHWKFEGQKQGWKRWISQRLSASNRPSPGCSAGAAYGSGNGRCDPTISANKKTSKERHLRSRCGTDEWHFLWRGLLTWRKVATQPSIWDSPDIERYKELYIHPQWENWSAFDPNFRWTWREENAVRHKVDWKIMVGAKPVLKWYRRLTFVGLDVYHVCSVEHW